MDKEANRLANKLMLADTDHDGPPTVSDLEVRDEIDFVITCLRQGLISNKTSLFCQGWPHGPLSFYGLPKVHKDQSKWLFGIPPFRPISASASYKAKQLLDTFLQPISTKHPSQIQGTPHLIQVLASLTAPPGALLFNCEVESL